MWCLPARRFHCVLVKHEAFNNIGWTCSIRDAKFNHHTRLCRWVLAVEMVEFVEEILFLLYWTVMYKN